ncbi:unnamed protein product, partial [Ascophyllum nodosum]
QISIRRKLSQKLVVKCDGQTLLDKRYIFSKPPPGHCFVAFTSVGISFAIYYQAVTTRLGRGTCQNLSSLRTNADHYELLVDGLKFMDLLDGSLVKTPHRLPLVENALKRYVLYTKYIYIVHTRRVGVRKVYQSCPLPPKPAGFGE